MPFLALLFTTLGLAPLQAPNRVSLYTHSRDSDAGFKDELLDIFRRDLGKQSEAFTEVAYSAKEAHVRVQFLGPGELTAELRADDEPIRYLFRPDEDAGKTWAIVRIGHFSKEFAVNGSGARDMSRLARLIADWIETNSSAIRERSLGR